LYDRDEDTHPLTLRFTALHALVIALDGFSDSPEASSEGALEAIQMVWYAEWQEDHDPAEDPYAR
jgi:FeS assembly protein IscX